MNKDSIKKALYETTRVRQVENGVNFTFDFNDQADAIIKLMVDSLPTEAEIKAAADRRTIGTSQKSGFIIGANFVLQHLTNVPRIFDLPQEKAMTISKDNPTAYEFHNYETGHCYVDYVEHEGMTEKEGYTKIPLHKI